MEDGCGLFLDAAIVKSARSASVAGAETLAYTFVLYEMRKWGASGTALTNLPDCQDAVTTLRNKVRKTKVKLSDELEQALNAWAEGEHLHNKNPSSRAPTGQGEVSSQPPQLATAASASCSASAPAIAVASAPLSLMERMRKMRKA